MPKDYQRVLLSMKKVEEQGLSGEEAIMAAFEANARDVARVEDREMTKVECRMTKEIQMAEFGIATGCSSFRFRQSFLLRVLALLRTLDFLLRILDF